MAQNVEEILTAFSEALEFWAVQLSASGPDLSSVVPPSTVDNPLEELVKITKLIRAHTTKVGIIFEPTKLAKSDDSARSTVADLSKSFVLFISALAQLNAKDLSNIFYNEIKSQAHVLVLSAKQFVEELKALQENAKKENEEKAESKTEKPEAEKSETEKDDQRLVSVGKLWQMCDEVAKLVEGGKLKVLEKKTKMHIGLIDDGLEEFAEWAENPEEMDDEDPFGLEDDFSDEESEEPPTETEASDDEGPSESKQELIRYCKLWLQKFKLVKLLLLSINKSLSSLASGEVIDFIYQQETAIVKDIDMLIVELMLNQVLDAKVDKHAVGVDKSCLSIINSLKQANKKSESKVKWCTSWETKYKELSEEMYTEK